MKLIWVTTCDEHGVKESLGLHYWSEDMGRWEPCPSVECKEQDIEETLTSKDIIYFY